MCVVLMVERHHSLLVIQKSLFVTVFKQQTVNKKKQHNVCIKHKGYGENEVAIHSGLIVVFQIV